MNKQTLMMDVDAFREVVSALGNQEKLAEAMGVTRAMLHYYQKNGLPVDRCIQMEQLSGVPRERLLPNLFRSDAA